MKKTKSLLVSICIIVLFPSVIFASNWNPTDFKVFYFDDPGIGTTTTITSQMLNEGFTVGSYSNKNRTSVLKGFENSHILHINTHGNEGYICVPGYSSITYNDISNMFDELPGLKFVYLDACKVAGTPFFQNALQACGVMSSLAFSENVSFNNDSNGINYYASLLYYYLSQGYTLENAKVSAYTGTMNVYPWCGCESAVVRGGSYTVQPDVTTFVNRLYQNCLERTPDASGYSSWKNVLENNIADGETVAYGFFFSTEFQALGLNNTDYVIRLYHTLLGREPDASGLSAWVSALNNGSTRLTVFNGFVNSTEFVNLCYNMGITP